MGLVEKYEYVLKDSSDKIYNFFINDREQLECIYSNNSNQWIDKTLVTLKACQHFAVAIDTRDRIHAFVIHANGDINYYWQEDKQWKSQKIASINRKNENVYYPDIVILKNQVHLFYLHQGSKAINSCTIQHVTKLLDKWEHISVETISYSKYINPFKVLVYDNVLHLLFASHNSICEECYLTKFNYLNNSWEFSIRLTEATERKIYLDGLIDKQGNLHITWSMLEENGLTIKYQQHSLKELYQIEPQQRENSILGKTVDEIGQLLMEEELQINTVLNTTEAVLPQKISQQHNCSFPYIIVFNKVLWLVWFQFNSLVSSYSTDNGLTWSIPSLIAKTKLMSFKRYRYATNSKLDNELIQCDYLFGTLYPNIQFIGFGGDINDDVSKNS